jgi:hypothetical protein
MAKQLDCTISIESTEKMESMASISVRTQLSAGSVVQPAEENLD